MPNPVSMFTYGPVRKSTDSGHEFILTSEMSGLQSLAEEKAAATMAHIPGWNAANPVVRIARFRVTEITD